MYVVYIAGAELYSMQYLEYSIVLGNCEIQSPVGGACLGRLFSSEHAMHVAHWFLHMSTTIMYAALRSR